MPSPKLIQVLRSKTKLTDEQIIGLSEAEGWAEVQKVDEQRRAEREANKKPEICFTGFNGNEREELETTAVIKGYKVRTSVTKNLDILVLGEAPGEKKIEKAEAQGVSILQLDEYESLASPNRVIEEAAIESMATYEPQTPTTPSNAKPKISKTRADNTTFPSFKRIISTLIILYSRIKQSRPLNLKEFGGRPLAG